MRRPGASRQALRNKRDTPPPWRPVESNEDYLNLSSQRHTKTGQTDYIDRQIISAPLKGPQQPSNSHPFHLPQFHYLPPSSSLPSPLETPRTSSTILTSITGGPEFIYPSRLHPTAAANHLRAPPRHRPSSPRPSSFLSSSADSITSNSQYVNPAYAAKEKARKAAARGKRRRWSLLGLGSEGDGSASGSGWVIKGRSPEQPLSDPAHAPSTSGGIAPIEASAEEVIAQDSTKHRPGPISIPHKASLRANSKMSPKSKFSARPTHPASAGTPQLDTISDGPRWAPKIKSMRRPAAHHPSPDPEDVELPNVWGRGVMTDQYFVRERDDESFVEMSREGRRRGAVRVDGRGRIVRA